VIPPWPHGDPRDVARAVLADPRYRSAARPGEKSWLDDLAEALSRFWSWITEPLRHVAGGNLIASIMGIAVLVAVAILLAVVIVRFARGARGARALRGRRAAFALGDEPDARALLEAALAASASGRHRDAAVLLWASALRALDERGRVRYDASRSPGEWRRAVNDPAFDVLARDAVVALFGDRGADADLVLRMRAAYDRVVGAA
jgi:hypothetical protein